VLGVESHVELDYQSLSLVEGDVFVLLTDGVHEHVDAAQLCQSLAGQGGADLDGIARAWVAQARERGSIDDATAQVVRVRTLPRPGPVDMRLYSGLPPCPPVLAVGQRLDGFTVLAELHASSRSHVYLVEQGGERAVMKIPSLDGRQDPAYLERLLLEAWFARRIASAHVVRGLPAPPGQSHLYVLMEPIDGITLAQWMRRHPEPSLDAVRDIVEQVARGLQAMHRRDILHRDLRPENILVDEAGTARIIDLGSAKALGVDALPHVAEPLGGMGTLAFSAPELFLGEPASVQSDQYALAAIAYQMLSGRLPYGTQAARTRTRAEQARLRYTPVVHAERDLPVWIDDTLARALHPDPGQRFEALSEFVQALRMPGATAGRQRQPLAQRNPVALWQGLCIAMLLALMWALAN
jgi:serine/threonine protein kinase/sulfur transfer complex TusBCD TusB component (DsrH family)